MEQSRGVRRRVVAVLLAATVVVTGAVEWSSPQTADAGVPARKIGPAQDVLQLQVTGRGGVPANAAAVAITVTVTSPSAAGWVTAWPCLTSYPSASVVNYAAGQTVANMVVVKPGPRGKVCLRSSSSAHVITDVAGYFPAGTAFRPSSRPARIFDSRTTGGKLAANQVRRVRVTGVGGVPTGAPAVALNLTVTSPSFSGYLRAFPCGQAAPNASVLNFRFSQTIANLSMLQPGTNAEVCLISSQPTHLVVDTFGYFASSTGFTPVRPSRILDTRYGHGGTRRPAGSTLQLAVTPTTAAAVGLNVTAVGPSKSGWLTVWPCGQPRPTASNVNFGTIGAVTNFVMVKPGVGGKVCIYTSAAVDLVADRFGYTPTAASFAAPTPSRLLDTRIALGMPRYEFLHQDDYGRYSRWNACPNVTITWRIINHLGRSAGELQIIRTAFSDLERATGFDFVETGSVVTTDPGTDDPIAADYGVDVLAGYDNRFSGQRIGVGGFYADPSYEIVEGFLWVRPGLSPADTRDVALHELGHMVGLGHTPDATQLMYDTLVTSHQRYEAGDLDGLGMVGRQMPCFPASLQRASVDRSELTKVTADQH